MNTYKYDIKNTETKEIRTLKTWARNKAEAIKNTEYAYYGNAWKVLKSSFRYTEWLDK